jgi:hypothetical protein
MKDKFQIGDYALAKRDINFINGERHLKGGIYLVTEDSLSYYNINSNWYDNNGLKCQNTTFTIEM